MAYWKKIMLIITSLIVFTIFVATIAFYISPKPGTALIRYAFNREVPIKNSTQFEKSKEVVNVIHNETYTSKYGRNEFDIYYPHDLKKGEQVPVIFWLHGGGYLAGDKSLLNEYAHTLIEQEKIALISINYEFAPELRYPGQLEQLNEAYHYIEQHAEKYPYLDMKRLVFGGDSAGAQIAGQYMLVQTNPQYASEMDMKASIPRDDVKAFISYCGPVDLIQMTNLKWHDWIMKFFASTVGRDLTGQHRWKESEAVQMASIARHVTSDFPPSYVTDGNAFTFPEQGQALVKALKEKDVPVQSRFFDDTDEKIWHEYQFSLNTEAAQRSMAETIAFLKKHID
ncbi:alpha/beta hydrolase [Kurthia massiliensis]|uniref:alpha/beta hydrolase n=1 Tax=Kurthia massiliensis TaxID=1033739 RepID=UPI00028A08FD|nr:alpha/beta hydrolase [Kurthia massiliensis]